MTEDLASGIHAPLSWNPDHSLIATIQEEKRKTIVAFYERNGLRHGEFTLPSTMQDIQIAYNATGSIIAIVGTIHTTPVLQLWTRMNYHWYMKLQRNYETPIQSIYWDVMNEMAFTVVFMVGLACQIHCRMVPQITLFSNGTLRIRMIFGILDVFWMVTVSI